MEFVASVYIRTTESNTTAVAKLKKVNKYKQFSRSKYHYKCPSLRNEKTAHFENDLKR